MNLPAFVEAYLDGEADDAQLDELAAWLREDREHPRVFMRVLRLHHALREGHLGAVATDVVGAMDGTGVTEEAVRVETARVARRPAMRLLPRRRQPQRRERGYSRSFAVIAAAACLMLGILGYLALPFHGDRVNDLGPVIAEITAHAADDAIVWRRPAAEPVDAAADVHANERTPSAADDWKSERMSGPASADARLRAGDVVENRSDTVVTVSFVGEATRVSLRPRACVEFDTGKPGKLVVLHAGAFDAVAAKQPAGEPMACIGRFATATIIGTTFSLIDAGSTTRLEVAEGHVRFTPTVEPAKEPIDIEVAAGEFAMAGPTGKDLVRPRSDPTSDLTKALVSSGPAIVDPTVETGQPPAGTGNIWAPYWSRWKHALPADPAFFPIAVWLQAPEMARDYHDVGVNLYLGLANGPTESQLSMLAAASMRVICPQNAVGLAHRDDPQIVGWMYERTPDNAQDAPAGDYGSSIEPDLVAEACRAIRTADPTRPIYMNFGPGAAYTPWRGRGHSTGHTDMYPGYIRGADIFSFNLYPLSALADDMREVRGNLWYVPAGVDHLRDWMRQADAKTVKPAWPLIECTRISSEAEQPTRAQVRSEVWMSLIHGASGICWFCHTFGPGRDDSAAAAHDPTVKATIDAIDREILDLAPALNARTVVDYARVVGSDAAVPIDAMAKRVGDATYLFTAAMRGKASSATITVLGAPSGPARVEVLGEQRTIDAPQGSFHDSFAPYGVHLYRIVSAAPAKVSPAP